MPADATYQFGPFEVDPRRRRLARDGEPVAVPGKAFDVLLALIEHRGRIVEKEELLGLVWPGVVVEEGNLSQHVFTLRKLLGDTSAAPAYLATIPRRGYQFVAEVVERQRVTAVGGQSTTRLDASSSVAILPFAALTPAVDDQYLGYGLADALLARLRAVRDGVRSPHSLTRLLTSPPDISATGRELGVDVVLHGAVQKRGEWIGVTAQLIAVRDRSLVWVAHVESATGDTLEIENELFERLCASLGVPSAAGRATTAIVDPRARIAMMTGRFHLARRSPEDLEQAVAQFERAAATESAPAAAYSGLAAAHAIRLITSFDHPAREAAAAAAVRCASERALAVDDTLADAHAALAEVAWRIDHDASRGAMHFSRAVALDPEHAGAHAGYALLLRTIDRVAEAESHERRAHMIDPVTARLAASPFASRDIAIAEAERICVMSGRRAMALSIVGYARARDGDTDAANEIVTELIERHRRREAPAWVIAYPFVGLGDSDRVAEWLTRGRQEGGALPALASLDPLVKDFDLADRH